MKSVETELTKQLGIKHPVMLAGMAKVSNPKLAAAVTNAGGLGVIGGVGYTPELLKNSIEELKAGLNDKNAPFGVDLLIPQVGGSARKTNYDYSKGQLPQLIDIIIESGAKLFVSAVGIPPKWAVDKLHDAGVLVGNMVGHPKHVPKALQVGGDIVIAQGHEAGGHTGAITTGVLVPQVVDICRGKKNFFGNPVIVIAAGGIIDGRGVASSLSFGASGVWMGTRFITAEESGASPLHQKLVVESSSSDTIRTTIYTGRPVRCIKNDYNVDYETNKKDRIEELQNKGIIVYKHDVTTAREKGDHFDIARTYPQYAGQGVGLIHEIKPAAAIVSEVMNDACAILEENVKKIVSRL